MAMALFSCRAPTNLTPSPSSVTTKTAVSSLMSPNTVRTPRAWMSSARIWNTGAIRLSFISPSPLLLRRELVPDAAQRERVAGDPEAGHDALAHRGRLRGRPAGDRVRDVHLGRGELDLGEGRDQRRVAAAERRRVEDRGIDARVV